MFAVFAYLVYFTILWMLFVSDEPATVTQQKKPAPHQAALDKPNQAPRLAVANSIHTTSQMALTPSRRVAKDLNQLGIRELRELSKGRIRGFMRLNKAELVQALQ